MKGRWPFATENNTFQCDRVTVHVVSLKVYHFSFFGNFFFYYHYSGETTSENKDIVSISVLC